MQVIISYLIIKTFFFNPLTLTLTTSDMLLFIFYLLKIKRNVHLKCMTANIIFLLSIFNELSVFENTNEFIKNFTKK